MGSKFGWFNQANQQFQKTRIRSNGCFTSVTQKKMIFSQSAIVALTLKVNCSISCTCITLLCTLSCRNYLHGTGTSSSRTFVTVFFLQIRFKTSEKSTSRNENLFLRRRLRWNYVHYFDERICEKSRALQSSRIMKKIKLLYVAGLATLKYTAGIFIRIIFLFI